MQQRRCCSGGNGLYHCYPVSRGWGCSEVSGPLTTICTCLSETVCIFVCSTKAHTAFKKKKIFTSTQKPVCPRTHPSLVRTWALPAKHEEYPPPRRPSFPSWGEGGDQGGFQHFPRQLTMDSTTKAQWSHHISLTTLDRNHSWQANLTCRRCGGHLGTVGWEKWGKRKRAHTHRRSPFGLPSAENKHKSGFVFLQKQTNTLGTMEEDLDEGQTQKGRKGFLCELLQRFACFLSFIQ